MTQESSERIRVGVLADPEAGSEEVAVHLAGALSGELARLLGGDRSEWDVRVDYERLPSGSDESSSSVLDRAAEWREEQGMTVAIGISDLPMLTAGEPIVADLSRGRRVAVLSVPAFGGMALRRRVRRMAAVLIAELSGRRDHAWAVGESASSDRAHGQGGARDASGEESKSPVEGGGGQGGTRHRRIPIGRHFEWTVPDEQGVDIRVLATRGKLRLLVGMVRDNRPWTLASGLSTALVAAFAISAFYLVSSVAWQMASTLGPARLAIVMLAALVLLVCWLILRHGMWERPARADLPYQREQIRLFNLSTLLTLAIGVLVLYGMLYVAILAAALLLIPGQLLADFAGSSGPGNYMLVSWMITSAATLAGALGSGLDSDRAVRAAAYGYRERERLNRWRQQHQES